MNEESDLQHDVSEVFLVMQGGGAKGIAHAGGLIAIEEEHLTIIGIAGTSAGSIAAALVAAGYSGKELADPVQKKHIFDRTPFGKGKGELPYSRPTDLFTPFGWGVLATLRLLNRVCSAVLFPSEKRGLLFTYWLTLACMMVTFGAGAFFFMPETLGELWRSTKGGFPYAGWVILGFFVFFLLWGLWGITSVRNVRKVVDAIISKKLETRLLAVGIKKTKDITFEDMYRAGCPPLKIIATNTATESLELFCVERTPHVSVADAVAASICLPGIFKPKRLQFMRRTPYGETPIRGKFLDGGLVSNLPAWALDEERLLHPNVPTIALSLSPPAPINNKFWFTALVGTIVNGSSEVHTRTPTQILTVALETKAKLLDFDLPAVDVFNEVLAAQSRVAQELSLVIRSRTLLQEAVDELHTQLTTLLQSFNGLFHHPHMDDRLRVAIAVQKGSSMRTVTTAFSQGFFPDDPDAGLTVLIEGSHQGEAWKGDVVIVDQPINGAGQHHALSVRAWPKVSWLLCYPVRYAAPPGREARPFIITVDANIALKRGGQRTPATIHAFREFQASVKLVVERYTVATDLAQYAQGANTWL